MGRVEGFEFGGCGCLFRVQGMGFGVLGGWGFLEVEQLYVISLRFLQGFYTVLLGGFYTGFMA